MRNCEEAGEIEYSIEKRMRQSGRFTPAPKESYLVLPVAGKDHSVSTWERQWNELKALVTSPKVL